MLKKSFLILFILTENLVFCDEVTKEVFGNRNLDFFPAAFGDFNADKLTDIFVIKHLSNGSSVIKVLLSNNIAPYIDYSGPECLFSKEIVNVSPSDFDGDGAMDVLVLTSSAKVLECYILWGNLSNLECTDDSKPILELKSEPALVNYNGDMITDLFGENSNGTRCFWLFGKDRKNISMILMNSGNFMAPIHKDGGHAFVDIDGDLAADLFVVTEKGFEIWLNSNDFKTNTPIKLPAIGNKEVTVIGQSVFCDFNMDGNLEMILPLCADISCSESYIYLYDFNSLNDSNWFNLEVDFKDNDGLIWTFTRSKENSMYAKTISPRVGDINLDGFPDILLTLFNGQTSKVLLLLNTKCSSGDCKFSRSLTIEWNTFDQWPNSVMGSFFDFKENGNLDVLLVNASSDGKKHSVGVYRDSTYYDVTFAKVMVLTGVCYSDCKYNKIPYGTNQPGPTIMYQMTSSEGHLQTSKSAQMFKTSNFALQLPFTIFGLGRSWNFIEKLVVGIPLIRNPSHLNISKDNIPSVDKDLATKKATSIFTQIIPNSQVVVIPYPLDKPAQWKTKLFLTPSKDVFMTLFALIATWLCVGAIVIVLHIREKHLDKKERRQQAQRFHFDAM